MRISKFVPILLSVTALAAFGTTPAAAQCNDKNSCTYDALVDGVCVYTSVPAGAFCSEKYEPCRPAPMCDGAGNCTPGPLNDCEDGNPCTFDFCGAGGICRHDRRPAGTACNLDSPCPFFCDAGANCVQGNVNALCNDDNVCTQDLCDPGTGCYHVNRPAQCDADHDICTSVFGYQIPPANTPNDDLCQNGVCTPGPPVPCEDGNNCTVDACDPSIQCIFASNGTCGGNPETLGYWKRLCEGPHPSGEFISDTDVACVRQSCTFIGVYNVAGVCDILQANPIDDKCEQAEAQLMALLLNVCRGRVSAEAPMRSHCSDHTTIGESRAEADGMLCSPLRDHGSCVHAECMSEEINSGKAQ